jgi:hypothetical protein
MATGSQADIQARLRALLPSEWFPIGSLPVLDTVLAGCASALSSIYCFLAFVRAQMRLATSTGGFIDIWAFDFFGYSLLRKPSEGDAAYQARITANLLAPRVTRQAMVQSLTTLTGRAPVIFEPFYPQDTGAYNTNTIGYGVAGGYGSYNLPAQAFVTAYRPTVIGPAYVGGYGSSVGGYGVGRLEYIASSSESASIQDEEIYAAITQTKAVGVTVWTQIED